jgi:hypothetical protein
MMAQAWPSRSLDAQPGRRAPALDLLVRAAQISESEWSYLGYLMEQAGCIAALSEMRAAHPEFDGELTAD